MSGDATNTRVAQRCDIFVNFDLDAAVPATIDDEYDDTWDLTGLLDQKAGSKESRSETVTDLIAWGDDIYDQLHTAFKLTRDFTALEVANETVHRLDNPGSTPGVLVVPNSPEQILIGFDFFRNGTRYRRLVSKNFAKVARSGDITDQATDAESRPFSATIFPDPDTSQLWIEQPPVGGS